MFCLFPSMSRFPLVKLLSANSLVFAHVSVAHVLPTFLPAVRLIFFYLVLLEEVLLV